MPDSFRPDLHDYLEAVLEASRRHPWQFVDHVPDLRALYQPQSLDAPDGSTCVWQQAVARSQHLMISGPAGAGKSSLLRYVAASLADRWLKRQPQPWLPVPVRAHDLAEGKPLTQALRDGVEHMLNGLLHRPLEVDFFDHEPPTEQWLILVDGLDEVRDHHQRAAVLQAVEHAARRASMRFVITSRPGVWNTDAATFTHYTLRPLLAVDLRRLVTRWLERRGRASKTVELWAHKMINLLGRGGWQPTPLIAAMICVLADTDPDQPEPTSLDGIYTAFVDRLVIRLTRVDEPAINSVQNQIHTLLEEAASQRLFSDPDARLLELVIASATTHGITPPAPLAADWHQTVEEVLLRSGLITKHGKELEFLHASFEEYYAPELDTRQDRRHAHRPGRVVLHQDRPRARQPQSPRTPPGTDGRRGRRGRGHHRGMAERGPDRHRVLREPRPR